MVRLVVLLMVTLFFVGIGAIDFERGKVDTAPFQQLRLIFWWSPSVRIVRLVKEMNVSRALTPGSWTLRGLWADYYTTRKVRREAKKFWQQVSVQKLNSSALTNETLGLMRDSIPNTLHENLWSEAWDNHGTMISYFIPEFGPGPNEYFSAIHEMYLKRPIQHWLEDWSCLPNNNKFQVRADFSRGIYRSVVSRHSPVLTCVTLRNQNSRKNVVQFVYEIHLCFNRKMNEVDCLEKKWSNECHETFVYPLTDEWWRNKYSGWNISPNFEKRSMAGDPRNHANRFKTTKEPKQKRKTQKLPIN